MGRERKNTPLTPMRLLKSAPKISKLQVGDHGPYVNFHSALFPYLPKNRTADPSSRDGFTFDIDTIIVDRTTCIMWSWIRFVRSCIKISLGSLVPLLSLISIAYRLRFRLPTIWKIWISNFNTKKKHNLCHGSCLMSINDAYNHQTSSFQISSSRSNHPLIHEVTRLLKMIQGLVIRTWWPSSTLHQLSKLIEYEPKLSLEILGVFQYRARRWE